MPYVSVVIPAFNAKRFVGAAIDSVLAQSVSGAEVIVVDDGSSDGTDALVRAYGPRVRYLRQENAGVAIARNNGLSESRAEYVAFLDADDAWLPEKLEKQTSALRAHPGKRACYSAFVVADSDLRPLRVHRSPRRSGLLEDLLLLGNVIGTPTTVLCDRELLVRTGGFDPGLSQCADWDLWIRLSLLTEFVYVDEPLAVYRQHAASMSQDLLRYERDVFRVLDKAFGSHTLPPVLGSRRKEAYGRMYTVLAGSYLHAFRFREFLRCAVRAIALDSRQAAYFLAFPKRRAYRALS